MIEKHTEWESKYRYVKNMLK